MELVQESVMQESDDENEMNLLNINKSRKKFAILDSESEDELPTTQELLSEKTHLVDINNANEVNSEQENDSSKEHEEVTPHNKSFPDEETAMESVIYTTNKKNKLVKDNPAPTSKYSLSTLCDSESEDETDKDLDGIFEENHIEPKVYKPSRKRKDKSIEMTAQDAIKQRSEIRAESERMLRESNISLPYHKPKSYTIREFLQKRSKLASALPQIPKAPPSVAIKMSKDQLKEVVKKLDERKKEVEEFYKSDSDDDDKDDPSDEIRSWLSCLVENAMDTVDKNSVKVTEIIKKVDDNESEKNKISILIKDKLNVQPKLSGSSFDIIDLEDGVAKPSKIKLLVEKLLQHSSRKTSHKHKVQLNVIEVGVRGEIINETVSMDVDDEEEEPPVIEIPGAKLKKLKEELEEQIVQKRLELWKQKHEQGDVLTAEKKIEDEDNIEKDILDDEEEEFEMTEESESDYDDEEDDYEIKEKPKPKSAFIDDEADEDEEIDDDNNGLDDINIDEDKCDVESEKNDDNCDADNEESEEPQKTKKKVRRRILKAFSADSDDEDDEKDTSYSESTKLIKYYTNDDDSLPPNLPKAAETPQRTQLERNKSEFEFLTPVTYLTGLQNLNKDPRFSKDSPPEEASLELESQVPKNLFPENQNSQSNIEDLAELCSGKFIESQDTEDLPNTQELINMCSGNFTGLMSVQEENKKTSEKIIIQSKHDNTEIKSLDEESEQIISQLLDEEELERFKKKFESPVNKVNRKNDVIEEVKATGFIASDDENEGLEVKKKKQKKIAFSDDESEDEVEELNDEEIDLQDYDDEEQQLENEIIAEEVYKATDFLDKEAELSESEWGSADEDEKGLDELEVEQGDEETFNENKVRSELERIHMRQLLDEDNREVKLLQELLLEDGEMHGTGRKRQFRWKALDSVDESHFQKRDDDDIFLDEEENEEEWRKMRHKREMFLKKKLSNVDDDTESILSDSQILKLGQQITKNKSFSSSNCSVNKTVQDDDKPFNLLSKRGSFLSRSDHVLERLAEITKVTATTNVGTTAKNSKSFVFQSVQAKETIIKNNNNKRKAAEATPMAIKKLRLDNLSPAVGERLGKNSKAKKLFKN